MKKLIYIILVLVFACDSKNATDCIQTAGTIIQQEFTVSNFDKIIVNRDIELIIQQGPQSVVVETGDNLLNDITVEVVNNQLRLTNDNSCNFVRDFGITKVFVTIPNLTEIVSSTQFEITSVGTLNFQDLRLISEDFTDGRLAIGDFVLNLDAENLQVTANNQSSIYLAGTVEDLEINFANGNGRFEAENLVAENVSVFHRGTNDILINPQQSLIGNIVSTGNIISFNQPPIVDIEEAFTGQLIFN